MTKKGSIKTYLLLFILGFLLLSSAINTVLTSVVINSNIREVLVEKAKDQVFEIGKQAEVILETEADPIEALQKFVKDKASQDNVTYAIIIDTNVKAVAHSDENKIGKVYEDEYTIDGAQNGKDQFSRWYAEVQEIWTYDIMQPIYKDGQLYGVIDIGVPESGITDIINSVIKYQILIAAIGFVVIAALMWIVIEKIVKAIKSLELLVEKTANLDFTTDEQDIKLNNRNDEIGKMSSAISEMRLKLKTVIEGILNTSHSLSGAAQTLSRISDDSVKSTDEINAAIGEMAKATEEQAFDTEKGAEQVNDLSVDIDQVLESTKRIVSMTGNMDTLSTDGVKTVLKLESWSMKNKESSQNVSSIVQEVDKTSSDISSIVNTITEIANQTNLLALNASIESARAGEAGKGFAVVAEEIRKLSEQTSKATEDIKHKIEAIQGISKNAVHQITESLKIVEQNSEAAQETKSIFDSIKQGLDETIVVAKDVTKLSDEMNKRKESIIGVIQNISASAEETSASTEEVSASAHEQLKNIETVSENAESLNQIANELNNEMKKFRL